MSISIKIGLTLLINLALALNAIGQIRPGKEFVDVIFPGFTTQGDRNAFPDSSIGKINSSYFIKTYDSTCISISSGGTAIFDTIWPLGQHQVDLPEFKGFFYDSILRHGIHLVSSKDISVYRSSHLRNGISRSWNGSSSFDISREQLRDTELTCLVPISKSNDLDYQLFSPGSSYRYELLTRNPNGGSPHLVGVFALIAGEDSTEIVINYGGRFTDFFTSTVVQNVGDTDTIKLNLGEVYYLTGFDASYPNLINKSQVFSTNSNRLKISYLEGNNDYYLNTSNPGQHQTYISTVYLTEDHVNDDQVDSTFHFGPIEGYLGQNISVFSSEDSTLVTINGATRLFSKNERLDTVLRSDIYISASNQIRVLGASLKTSFIFKENSNEFSSFSWNILGDSNGADSIHIPRIPNLANTNVMVQINCKSVDTSQVKVNNSAIQGFKVNNNDPAFSYINYKVGNTDSIITGRQILGYLYTYNDSGQSTINSSFGNFGANLSKWGRKERSSFSVFINDQLISLNRGDTLDICYSDSIKIFPRETIENIWQVSTSDSSWLDTTNANSPFLLLKASVLTKGFKLISIQDLEGCLADFSFRIRKKAATYQIRANLLGDCTGKSIEFDLAPNSFDYDSIKWFINGNYYTEPKIRIINPKDSLFISLEVIKDSCVFQKDTAIILDNSDNFHALIFPNVMTPNGDGVNDELCFSSLASYTRCFSFEVYNRNGTVLYKSTDPSKCWSPRNLPSGVYFYQVRIQDKTYQNFITLISIDN